MTIESNKANKKSPIRKFSVLVIVALCMVFIYMQTTSLNLLSFFNAGDSSPKPPDLSRCTRLEINFYRSVLGYIQRLDDGFDSMSSDEIEYLKSLEKIVIDDKKAIKKISRFVSKGHYRSDLKGAKLAMIPPLSVACYSNDERVAIFAFFDSDLIWFDNGEYFKYDTSFPDLLSLSPEIKNIWINLNSIVNLAEIYDASLHSLKENKKYPRPEKWCDVVIRNISPEYEPQLSREQIEELLRSPGAGEGKCHYAMNPNCGPYSPGNMVLLFETKDGWNQYGGPELFTFDNHNPRGGCVLLNDGTVKFIRTEEELNNLRWE